MVARNLAVVAAVGAALGCSHNVYSPPARPIPLEAPRALAEGKSSVSIHGGQSGALFGPGVGVGTITGRRGVGSGLEVGVEGSLVHVYGDSQAPISREILAGRAGAKLELGTRHLAVTAGMGAGSSAGGPFLSPDLGVIFGYDNEVVIPFVSLQGMLSSPLGARDVDVTPAGGTAGANVGRPRFTQGLGATLGARLPLGDPHGPGVSGALFGGWSMMKLYSHGDTEGFSGFAGGAAVVF